MDVHEDTATVREALVFSAVLRQPSTISYEDKISYVDHIIELLELSSISDALIGGKFFDSHHLPAVDPMKCLVRV